MEQFTYQVPKKVHISTIIPIINEQGKVVFEIRKQQHKFLARIVHNSLRGGIPYSYKIANGYGKPLYTIDCAFPGIRYKLTDHLSSQTVSIASQRVHLIEKAYHFRLDHHEYFFEKDYTSAGYLKCNNNQVATVSIPINTNISLFKELELDTIIIKSTTQEVASLAAVLYHTFYYYGA
ncbi:tubby C-terminal domain-like protein [Bacillus sp. OTU2372]|uniref:tubby C-terminal domain-like protein n=1 Tax=Bacillus sp. OTU2372 TaxID=3043858 RepID=UPI00313C20DE